MREVVVFNSVTLDGIMQAPGRPDEDTRGGFEHGGWAAVYADPVLAGVAGEGMAKGADLLLGRRTYQDFAAVWPSMPQPNPFTDVLNKSRKYVASRTLKEPLPWQNSTLLAGEAAQAVARLKAQPGKDLLILGSGVLVQSLMRQDIVDQYILLIHPLILGSGRRLFAESHNITRLRLVGTKTTTTGVLIATYRSSD